MNTDDLKCRNLDTCGDFVNEVFSVCINKKDNLLYIDIWN